MWLVKVAGVIAVFFLLLLIDNSVMEIYAIVSTYLAPVVMKKQALILPS
jgi:hypothetical protein